MRKRCAEGRKARKNDKCEAPTQDHASRGRWGRCCRISADEGCATVHQRKTARRGLWHLTVQCPQRRRRRRTGRTNTRRRTRSAGRRVRQAQTKQSRRESEEAPVGEYLLQITRGHTQPSLLASTRKMWARERSRARTRVLACARI